MGRILKPAIIHNHIMTNARHLHSNYRNRKSLILAEQSKEILSSDIKIEKRVRYVTKRNQGIIMEM